MAATNKSNSITRAEQKQLTRQKIIDATLDVIAKEGFSGVTMAKVAETAGLSRGIGNFHFQSKEQLLLETLLFLQQEFDVAWTSAITKAGPSPIVQLTALIRSVLEPPVADYKKLSVWIAYWGEAPSRTNYKEICAVYDRVYYAAIEKLLDQMVNDTFESHGMSLSTIANGLIAMIDGFWLEYLLSPNRFFPKDAVQACFAYLASFFPEFQGANKKGSSPI